MANKPKLGSGKRFKNLTEKLERQGKSEESAKAIAASVGRKKYVDIRARLACRLLSAYSAWTPVQRRNSS
ncbi:MAG: hypothetical protein EBZ49_06235 [Proteobacteria bacterium]|nr:hypothetical protein [Pseudomonadota bacterium]